VQKLDPELASLQAYLGALGMMGKTDDAWFEGLEDPNLTAIKVVPIDSHDWDAKSNCLISMAKIGIAAITGKQSNLAEEGDLIL